VGVLGLTCLAWHARVGNEGRGVGGEGSGGGGGGGYDDWGEDGKKTTSGGSNGKGSALQWIRCSDENPASQRCFMRAVNSMPTEVTGKIHRAQKYKNNMKNNKNNKNNNNNEMTMEELMQNMLSESSDTSSQTNKSSSTNSNTQQKITYKIASATTALHAGQALGASTLLVSPPRRGLDDEVLAQLCKPHNPTQDYTDDAMFLGNHMPKYAINWVNDVETLVYVSCGFDSLARDCDDLLKGGSGWKLESAEGYVLFPGSNHVESLVVFTRDLGRRMEI